MLLSTKYNFAFLANPKCASRAISRMLGPYSELAITSPPHLRHTTLADFNTYIRPLVKKRCGIEKIETVAIIREPLSWLDSWYRFRSRYALLDDAEAAAEGNAFGLSFEEFLRAYMADPPPLFADVGSQYEFLVDDGRGERVDHLFLYEHITDFTGYMNRKIGRKLKLKANNVSPRTSTSSRLLIAANLAHKLALTSVNRRPKIPDPLSRYDLSESVIADLKVFLSRDFALHEKVVSDLAGPSAVTHRPDNARRTAKKAHTPAKRD